MARSIINAYREAYGGLSREVWFLSLALLINRCGSMVLAFLTLYLTEKYQFSVFDAGCIFSIFGLGSIAGSYVSGKLIKPVGAIRLQIIALAISSPCFMIVPLFSTFSGIAMAIFLMSFFSEAVRPANNVAIMQFTPPELHTRAFGLQRMALNLGYSIGPAVGGVLAEYYFDSLFYVDGLTTLIGAILLASYFGLKRQARTSNGQGPSNENLEGSGTPLADSSFLGFLFLMLLVSIIFFQFHATYPKYLRDHYHLSKPLIGILYSVNTVVIVIVEMLLLNYVRRFRLLSTIGIGCALSCIGFAVLPFSDAMWFSFASMLIITVGEMLMFPLATGFVAKRSSGRDAGMYMSWYAMTYSLTAIISPLLGTFIYERNIHAIWYLAGVVAVVVWLGFLWLDRKVSLPPESQVAFHREGSELKSPE